MVKPRKKWLLITLATAVALFLLIDRALIPALASRTDPYQPFKLLSQVVYLVKNDYVEKPDAARTMQGALKGLVDSLDILSSYLGPEHVGLYRDRGDPGLWETGLILYKSFGVFPVVIGIKPGSPAEKEGIRIGDSISAIDGESTLGMSMLEANLATKDRTEAPVVLRLVRAQGDQNIELTRTKPEETRFEHRAEEGTAGILTVHSLFPPLVDQVKEKLSGIPARGFPLILDFRYCGDGSLDEAVRFVNLFVKHKRIGWLEGRDGARTTLSASAEPEYPRFPLIVWTAQTTIGPAEIAAAALQKYREARVVGRPTLGLGARRDLFPLEDGSAVVLTTGVFRLEDKTEFWTKGLLPDTALEQSAPDRAAYLKATLENESKR